MITLSNKNQIYIGREAGKEILNKIKNAKKSVKVVSPYLSPDYIKDLIRLHKKGVEITLITSDNICEENAYSDFKVSDLVTKEKTYNFSAQEFKRKSFILSLWIFGITFIFLLIAFLFLTALIMAGVLAIIGTGLFLYSLMPSQNSYKFTPIFKIKVFDSKSGENPHSTELVHSKIFVIDEEVVFLGSVNFTYSGFKTHYETAIKVEDKKAVKDISEEVRRLYNSNDLNVKDVREW